MTDTARVDFGRVISDVTFGLVVVGAIGALVARTRRNRLPPPELSWPELPEGATPVLVSSLGPGIMSATMVRLLKDVGEAVTVGEPLMELSLDKFDVEIPSSVEGVVVAAYAQASDEVPVGFPVVAVRVVPA